MGWLLRRRSLRTLAVWIYMLTFTILGLLTFPAAGRDSSRAAFGTRLLNGEDWLYGQGVAVFSNGRAGSVCDPGTGRCASFLGATYVGIKWQCVELVQRLYTETGWHKGAWDVDAWQMYAVAPGFGFERYANGSGYLPVPGDLIIVGRSALTPHGHVSVANSVLSNKIQVVEQNWAGADAGFGFYDREGSMISRDDLPVVGVLHDPDNPLM